jgi:hypothetical protein
MGDCIKRKYSGNRMIAIFPPFVPKVQSRGFRVSSRGDASACRFCARLKIYLPEDTLPAAKRLTRSCQDMPRASVYGAAGVNRKK